MFTKINRVYFIKYQILRKKMQVFEIITSLSRIVTFYDRFYVLRKINVCVCTHIHKCKYSDFE